jgi:hypothetical protein
LTAHGLDVLAKTGDAVPNAPLADFKFTFARSPRADAAGLLLEPAEFLRGPGEHVIQLGQLHLQLAFPRAGALGENIQNQARAVDDFGRHDFLQVPLLGGRQLGVNDHRAQLLLAGEVRDLLDLAPPEERRRIGARAFLHHVAHRGAPGGLQQTL